jgi:hypothetical protein
MPNSFAVREFPVRQRHAIWRAAHVLATSLPNDLAPKSFVSLNRSSLTSCHHRSPVDHTILYGSGERTPITGPLTPKCAGRSRPSWLARWALFPAFRRSLPMVRQSTPEIAIRSICTALLRCLRIHSTPTRLSHCPFSDHTSQPSPNPHSFLCPATGLFQGPFPCITPGRLSRPASVKQGTRRSAYAPICHRSLRTQPARPQGPFRNYPLTLPCEGSLRTQPAWPQAPLGKTPFQSDPMSQIRSHHFQSIYTPEFTLPDKNLGKRPVMDAWQATLPG